MRPEPSKSSLRLPKQTHEVGGLRGTDRPRPIFMGGLSAPRLAASLPPGASGLLPVPRAPHETAADMNPGTSSRGGRRVRPEVVRYTGRASPSATPFGPRHLKDARFASSAASLIPRSRRSAARVLMDEGWRHCTRGLEGGDKFRRPNALRCGDRSRGPLQRPDRALPRRLLRRRERIAFIDLLAEAPVGHPEMLPHHVRMIGVDGSLNEFLRFLDIVHSNLHVPSRRPLDGPLRGDVDR
jgi:hypothetical protein